MLSELVFFRYIQLLLYFFSSFFCIFLDFFHFFIYLYIQNIYISIVIGVTEGSNGP